MRGAQSGVRRTTGAADRALARVLQERDSQRGGFMMADRAGKISKSQASAILRADEDQELPVGNPNARRANGQGSNMSRYRLRKAVEPIEDEDEHDQPDGDEDLDDSEDEELDENGNVGDDEDDDLDAAGDGYPALVAHQRPAPRTGPKGVTGQTLAPMNAGKKHNMSEQSKNDQRLFDVAAMVAQQYFGVSLTDVRTMCERDFSGTAQRLYNEIYRVATMQAGKTGRLI